VHVNRDGAAVNVFFAAARALGRRRLRGGISPGLSFVLLQSGATPAQRERGRAPEASGAQLRSSQSHLNNPKRARESALSRNLILLGNKVILPE